MSAYALPGWYPDASLPGHERWWDGLAWTAVTRPEGGLAESAPSAPVVEEQPVSVVADQQVAPAAASMSGASMSSSPTTGQLGIIDIAAAAGGRSADGWSGYAPSVVDLTSAQAPVAATAAVTLADVSAAAAASAPGVTVDNFPSYKAVETPQNYPVPQVYGTPTPQAGQGAYPSDVYPSTSAQALPTATAGAALASRWTRLLARFIDNFIVTTLIFALGFPSLKRMSNAYVDAASSADTATGSIDPNILSQNGFWAAFAMFAAVSLLVGALYEIVLVRTRGATVGKMATGLRVVNASTGSRPGWGASTLRWIVPQILSTLDVIWCLWDKRKQCLHDKVADTIVVRQR